MAFSNKKTKQNLFKSDSENKAEYAGFIVQESNETCLVKLSSFMIENIISSKATS